MKILNSFMIFSALFIATGNAQFVPFKGKPADFSSKATGFSPAALINRFDAGPQVVSIKTPAPDDAANFFPTPGKTNLFIALQPGEKLWAGVIKEGHLMPYGDAHQFDFYANNMANQLQPLLLSNQGLWVWSEEPYQFEISGDKLIISEQKGEIRSGRAQTLAEAYRYAANNFFPPSGKMPDPLLFSAPQYNTWIELTYNQNQQDVLKYARAIIDNGFPPGVLMIDDTWQEDYGLWRFHPGRFPDPKQMMEELHALGFKVMLWVCPFVSADQAMVVREIMKGKGFLLQKEHGRMTWESASTPAAIPWWNGQSALLDFTNPAAVKWFKAQLDRLVQEFGVDGFKLDAGDMDFYPPSALSKETVTPNRHCELFAQFGLDYPLNEYRACWMMGNQPLAQRLHDKNHSWQDLQMLIPHMIIEGLSGYAFSCPDMIGGGEYNSFLDLDIFDEELVVRSAQCHALMPMMQFSVAPWRILSPENLVICKSAAELHARFGEHIVQLALQSAHTGEPILRSLEYAFPHHGYENIKDQFLLGEDILVAPVVVKGARSRTVQFPPGVWRDEDGKKFKGPRQVTVSAPLETLPWFVKVKK